MKAVRLFEFGGPDRLVYGDYPMPELGPGDVLVKVLATSVSRWDVKYRTGEVHEFYGKATGHHGGIAGREPFQCRCSSGATWPARWCRPARKCAHSKPATA